MTKVAFALLPFKKPRVNQFPELQRFWGNQWRRRLRRSGQSESMQGLFEESIVPFDQPEVPYTAIYLLGLLRQWGCNTCLLDLWDYGIERLDSVVINALSDSDPDVIMFSPFTNNYSASVECLRIIKKQAPSVVSVVGGHHVTSCPMQAIRDGFDIVVLGKGELALRQLASIGFRPDGPTGIPQVLFRGDRSSSQAKRVIDTSRFVEAILPAYDLLPSRYCHTYYTRLFTSHGCPYNCVFCSNTVWSHQRPAYASIERVKSEISLIKKHVRFKEVYVNDETFTLRPDRSLEIAEILQAEGIAWGCETRIDRVDQNILRRLAAMGCLEIDYGVESMSRPILIGSKKAIEPTKIEEVLKKTADYGIRTHINLMIGLPGETEATAKGTVDEVCSWIQGNIVNTVDYFVTVPYPGTELFRNSAKYQIAIKTEEWDRYREDDEPVFDLPHLAAKEILALWLSGLEKLSTAMES